MPTISNHRTNDVILPSHVTNLPYDMEDLTDAQVSPLVPYRAPLSSGLGLTGLAPRRRVLQRQLGRSGGLDEVDRRSNDSDNDISQFNSS